MSDSQTAQMLLPLHNKLIHAGAWHNEKVNFYNTQKLFVRLIFAENKNTAFLWLPWTSVALSIKRGWYKLVSAVVFNLILKPLNPTPANLHSLNTLYKIKKGSKL